jgi:hypothetical protein
VQSLRVPVVVFGQSRLTLVATVCVHVENLREHSQLSCNNLINVAVSEKEAGNDLYKLWPYGSCRGCFLR